LNVTTRNEISSDQLERRIGEAWSVKQEAPGHSLVLPENCNGVLFRLSGMNDYRQASLVSQLDLDGKYAPLHVTRAVVVVVVESNLAPANHLFAARRFQQPRLKLRVVDAGLMRMNSDRAVDQVVLFSEPEAYVERTLCDVAAGYFEDEVNTAA
jgi:hypothetical protein